MPDGTDNRPNLQQVMNRTFRKGTRSHPGGGGGITTHVPYTLAGCARSLAGRLAHYIHQDDNEARVRH